MPTKLLVLRRVRRSLLYVAVTATLTTGLVALDRMHAESSPTPITSSTSAPSTDPSLFSAGNVPPCGSQLGFAGVSVTLRDTGPSVAAVRASLGLADNDMTSEFIPLTDQASVVWTAPAAPSFAFDRVRLVRTSGFAVRGSDAAVAKLQTSPGVATAEPVWLQSSDRKYLSCDYKLRDNQAAQAVAQVARQALIAHGVSSATLDDTGTMEFVSVRHFNGQEVLQVAFVRRPVGAPSVAYVALLNRSGSKALAV